MRNVALRYSPTVCADREGLPCGSGGSCPRLRGATVPQSCGGRVVTRGICSYLQWGLLPSMVLLRAMRTQAWDWEGALSDPRKLPHGDYGVRKRLHAKTERDASDSEFETTKSRLLHWGRSRSGFKRAQRREGDGATVLAGLAAPPWGALTDRASALRLPHGGRSHGREAAKGGRVYHDLATATPLDRPP